MSGVRHTFHCHEENYKPFRSQGRRNINTEACHSFCETEVVTKVACKCGCSRGAVSGRVAKSVSVALEILGRA